MVAAVWQLWISKEVVVSWFDADLSGYFGFRSAPTESGEPQTHSTSGTHQLSA